MKRLLLVLAACGDNAHAPVDAAPDAAPVCTATFTGNFREVATAAACASVMPGDGAAADHTVLRLALPVATLDAELAFQIDLGAAAAPGGYSSVTSSAWGARAIQRLGDGLCVYNAGTDATPRGSFTANLTALDASTAHGTASLTLYVLTSPGTDCGDADTEQVDFAF